MVSLSPAPKEAISNTDPRIKLIKTKIKKENYQPDALIEILHTVQNAYGFLPLEILKLLSFELKLPPSHVYATATFYHFFSLKLKGKHSCLVCTGTACYVKAAGKLLQAIEQQTGIASGQVSKDGNLGVEVARCIGACGMAPVVMVDDEMIPRASLEEVLAKIQEKTN
jgi:bidirectional [NiFe] hydrogenase diaphorase subunit